MKPINKKEFKTAALQLAEQLRVHKFTRVSDSSYEKIGAQLTVAINEWVDAGCPGEAGGFQAGRGYETPLTHKAAVKRLMANVLRARGAVRPRVPSDVYVRAEAFVFRVLQGEILRHPSVGKTLTF